MYYGDLIIRGIKENLVGKKFGNLLVIEVKYQQGEHKRTICECVCDCGITRSVEATCLKRYTKSCKNCTLKRIRSDLIGKKFGNYTVLDVKYGQGKYKKAMCECICDCGNTRFVDSTALTRGKSKSCGCYKLAQMSKFKRWCGEMSGTYFNRIENSARKRKLEFNITKEYLWNLFLEQNRKCALSGEELIFSKSYSDQNNQTASIDRIDSLKGYVEGNVQWIHKNINVMKMAMPESIFIEWCDKIHEHSKNKETSRLSVNNPLN